MAMFDKISRIPLKASVFPHHMRRMRNKNAANERKHIQLQF